MPWYWVAAIVVIVVVVILSRRGENPGRPAAPRVSPDKATWTEADVDAQIRAGHKIEAIKIYRHLHGTDLKDSKDAVEARAKTLGA